MLVAVLSDIHANDVALRRCIEHAISRGAEAFCFLGDYVGDLAGVRETMKLLRGVMDAHPCVLLRGNKEDYWLAPAWTRTTIQLLRHGAPPKLLSLCRAMELCRERTGRCVWPDIPEGCWEAALEEMNVEQLRTEEGGLANRH